MVPCALLWNMTRQHLPRLAGLSLVVFWVLAPVVLYLCIRHVIIRRRESWSVKDRRIAYTAATLTLLIGSLSFGTFKSDAEVEHSLNKGHDIVNAVKHYYTVHRKLPESLDTLVPVYFASVPETDVPEGWGGHEAFVYQASGERSFSVTFESASYATCNYERTEDSWDCH
jgi:hypothetical protein